MIDLLKRLYTALQTFLGNVATTDSVETAIGTAIEALDIPTDQEIQGMIDTSIGQLDIPTDQDIQGMIDTSIVSPYEVDDVYTIGNWIVCPAYMHADGQAFTATIPLDKMQKGATGATVVCASGADIRAVDGQHALDSLTLTTLLVTNNYVTVEGSIDTAVSDLSRACAVLTLPQNSTITFTGT